MWAEIRGKLLVIDTQGVSHLMEEPGDGIGADDDTEVCQRHGYLVGSSSGPLQPRDGIAGRVVFEQELDQDDDVEGFFFSPLASATGTARAASHYILIEQLLTAAGDGMGIQAKEFGHNTIAAVSQLDGLQASEQTALLLIEQAVEKQDGGLEFIGRYPQNGGVGHQGGRLRGLPRTELIASLLAVGGSIKETPGQLRAAQTSRAHQIVEGILDLGMEGIGQFVGKPTLWGLIDKGLDACHQGAEAGKPNRIVGPQAGIVEAGGFAKGIIAAAMGVAGQVIQSLQLAKDSEVGRCAQSLFELWQGSDFVAQQMPA
jgi:hypothetical protein